MKFLRRLYSIIATTLTVKGNVNIQAGQNASIGTLDNYALSLKTNNADRIYITNTGNVGIGTTAPSAKLSVVGNATVSGNITVNSVWATGDSQLSPLSIPSGTVFSTQALYPHNSVLPNWFGEDLLAFKAPYKVERWDSSTSSWIDVTANADWKKVTTRTGSGVGEGIQGRAKYRFYFDMKFPIAINGFFMLRGSYNLSSLYELILEASDSSDFSTSTVVHSSSFPSGFNFNRGFLVANTSVNNFNRYLRITLDVASENNAFNIYFFEFYFIRAGGQSGLGNTFLVPIFWDDNLNIGIGTTNPSAKLHVIGSVIINGAFSTKVTTITANTTLDNTYHIVLANATSNAITITLPNATTCAGRQYVIKKIDSTSNAVTIVPSSGQTIDGQTSINITTQNDLRRIVSNGTNWYII